MKNKIRTIFIGTPDFGLPAMKELVNDSDFDLVAVITQPDKPVGRKQILTQPPIKVEAIKNNIPVLQPDRISAIKNQIAELAPDVIVVAAYAQIIPEEILNTPKYGSINIHGSLLPKYRGASCIQAAILNGDKETGITIMKMDAGLDTGPILAQNSLEITPNDNTGTLYAKLSDLGAKTLIPALKKYINKEITSISQDNAKSSYAKQLKKEDGKIEWQKSAGEIEKFVRAMHPWPGAFSTITNKEKKKIKIIETENRILSINKYKIGEIFLDNNELAVQCGQDALIVKKLQIEGKKESSAEEFLRGHKDLIGQILE